MTDLHYAIKVLAKLVSFNTDSTEKKNYVECARYIHSEAKRAGLKSTLVQFTGGDGKPRPNVLIGLGSRAKETVMLLTHFDVVPEGSGWKTNPFRLAKKGSRFIARGVCDDKGGVACCLAALREAKKKKLALKRNVKMLVVCDEEVGGQEGVGLLVKREARRIESDFCVAIDGELDYVALACSGVIRGSITLKGRGGHAAYDFETPNLLHKAIAFAEELKQFKKSREETRSMIDAPKNPVSRKMFGRFNITIFKAGTQFNVLPSEVNIGFDLRLVPEEKGRKTALEFRKYAARKAGKLGLKPKFDFIVTDGYYTTDGKFTGVVKRAAEKAVGRKLSLVSEFGGTDSRFISLLGIPSYTYGPGGKDKHGNTESISTSELRRTTNFIKGLFLEK